MAQTGWCSCDFQQLTQIETFLDRGATDVGSYSKAIEPISKTDEVETELQNRACMTKRVDDFAFAYMPEGKEKMESFPSRFDIGAGERRLQVLLWKAVHRRARGVSPQCSDNTVKIKSIRIEPGRPDADILEFPPKRILYRSVEIGGGQLNGQLELQDKDAQTVFFPQTNSGACNCAGHEKIVGSCWRPPSITS